MIKYNWKEWVHAAGIRAIKTMAQTIAASVAVGSAVTEVNWAYVLGVTATAGVLSICTSLAGLPELDKKE